MTREKLDAPPEEAEIVEDIEDQSLPSVELDLSAETTPNALARGTEVIRS